METCEVKPVVEAILFSFAEPISADKIAEAAALERELVEKALQELQNDYDSSSHGLCILQLEDKWQMSTKSRYSAEIKKALDTKKTAPLSNAALEVLAIIAYNQPVSRSFIEQVRGVDSSSSVSGLLEKGLIEEAGRLDIPGHPISFRTTDSFLRCFGLSGLADLPELHPDKNYPLEQLAVSEPSLTD